MRTFEGIVEVPDGFGPSVATVGMFDGVHRGHRALIREAVSRAGAAGAVSVMVTFDRHPLEVLRPGEHPVLLTSLARKARLVEGLGIDTLLVLAFTEEFSRLSAADFVRTVLVDALCVRGVVVGANFRFGHRSAGDLACLADMGSRLGFSAVGVDLEELGDQTISSTRIRRMIERGEVEAAAKALERPHCIDGVVVKGDARGRVLGFPTANLQVAEGLAVPGPGVYAGRMEVGGTTLACAISVGTNPTFGGTQRRVEAFVLDFRGEMYGEVVALSFEARLREERTFADADGLITQIRRDVEATRAILGPEATPRHRRQSKPSGEIGATL
ncbi:MAG: bifunctional riboflavin kinase/FAD synthetase [Actinomycetota bacterium]